MSDKKLHWWPKPWKTNTKALAIAPIVTSLAVVLFVEITMGLPTPLANAKPLPNAIICGEDCNGITSAKAPLGPAHITIYNIPYGHDGWVVGGQNCIGTNLYGVGPVKSPCSLGVIDGKDLGNITSRSMIIAIQVGTSVTDANGVNTPYCTVWTPIPNGFHAYCADTNNLTTLRVAVINP